jgi:hypothetical protein
MQRSAVSDQQSDNNLLLDADGRMLIAVVRLQWNDEVLQLIADN